MSKHTFKETTTISNNVYFAGEADISEADAKALRGTKTVETGTNETEEVGKPLAKMTKAELVAEAESLGVSVTPDSMTNKQIIEAIEAAGE